MKDTNPIDLNTRLALRPEEAARVLGISKSTFERIQHEFPCAKIDRAVLIPVEAVRRWLENKTSENRIELDNMRGNVRRILSRT